MPLLASIAWLGLEAAEEAPVSAVEEEAVVGAVEATVVTMSREDVVVELGWMRMDLTLAVQRVAETKAAVAEVERAVRSQVELELAVARAEVQVVRAEAKRTAEVAAVAAEVEVETLRAEVELARKAEQQARQVARADVPSVTWRRADDDEDADAADTWQADTWQDETWHDDCLLKSEPSGIRTPESWEEPIVWQHHPQSRRRREGLHQEFRGTRGREPNTGLTDKNWKRQQKRLRAKWRAAG